MFFGHPRYFSVMHSLFLYKEAPGVVYCLYWVYLHFYAHARVCVCARARVCVCVCVFLGVLLGRRKLAEHYVTQAEKKDLSVAVDKDMELKACCF